MWAAASTIALAFVLADLPTPLYRVYLRVFHFSPLMLTFIYAAYVAGTLTVMFFLGRLSDEIGRRPIALAAVAVALLGAVAFLVAWDTAWLWVARILSGVALALAAGAGTAWILELHPDADNVGATQLAIAASMFGLGAGPLVAGALVQYGPAPLRFSYALYVPLAFLAAAAAFATRETVAEKKPWREVSLTPRLGVPEGTCTTPSGSASSSAAC